VTIVDHDELLVKPGCDVGLANFDAGSTGTFHTQDHAQAKLQKDIKRLAELQDVFYASEKYALLIVLQGMDAAGKDGAIKHVMTGVNPQGVDVNSFKVPSAVELEHDYLWRDDESTASAWTDRHFQSLLLRGARGRSRPFVGPRA
jgi:polyphosphate kinase 2 (PPK2 family)